MLNKPALAHMVSCVCAAAFTFWRCVCLCVCVALAGSLSFFEVGKGVRTVAV